GEIGLWVGLVAGIGGSVCAELVKPETGWPWWLAIIVALGVTAAIGLLQGLIITKLHLPSFVVTLAGLLAWQGVMLLILGNGGTQPINDTVINNIASGNLTPAWSWIAMILIVGAFGLRTWFRESRRRAAGLTAPPAAVT